MPYLENMAWKSIYILLFYANAITYACPNNDAGVTNAY